MVSSRLIMISLMGCFASVAMGQELIFKDKVGLGEKSDSGACLAPDGKKVLLANRSKDENAIAYTLIGIDGKDKKQIYKFKLPDIMLFYTMLPSRYGNISIDGGMFVACPDLNDEDGSSFMWQSTGPPAVTCDMAGKTKLIHRTASKSRNSICHRFEGLLTNGVFGKEGEVYYVHQDYFTDDREGILGTTSIMMFDPKTGKSKVLVELNALLAQTIFISPDRSRLAGIAASQDVGVGSRKSVSPCLWAYDIKTGQASYSVPIPETLNFRPTHIVWSQDNSTMYAAEKVWGAEVSSQNNSGLFAFKPFSYIKPDQDETARLGKLAEQLGSEDSEIREKAAAGLRAAGQKAAEILSQASKSTDLEVAKQARKLHSELAGKLITLLNPETRNIFWSFLEIAPGYLYVKTYSDKVREVPEMVSPQKAQTILIEVATGKAIPVKNADTLVLIDKTGDTGLLMDFENYDLWTAKVVFSSPQIRPAIQSSSQPMTDSASASQ